MEGLECGDWGGANPTRFRKERRSSKPHFSRLFRWKSTCGPDASGAARGNQSDRLRPGLMMRVSRSGRRMCTKPNAIETRFERDGKESSDAGLLCSASKGKRRPGARDLALACTSAGNERQALSFAGTPASWDRSSREKTAPIAVLAHLFKRRALRENPNASDVRRLNNKPRRARFGKPTLLFL